MKKYLSALILPLAIVAMSSCSLYNGKNKDGSPKDGSSSSSVAPTTQTSTSGEEPTSSSSTLPPAPTGSVNLYLVLGPNGLFDGQKQADYAPKFLENTYTGSFKIGDPLPGKDKITSDIEGSSFDHWINRNTTETVSVVPAEDSVLVAVFEGGEGGNKPTPSSGVPTEGYGFLFETPDGATPYWKVANYVGEWTDGEGRTFEQHKIDDFQLIEKQKFRLYNFGSNAGWTVPLDPHSCGQQVDDYLKISDGYYEVLQTFNTNGIYIKLLYEHDQLYIGN